MKKPTSGLRTVLTAIQATPAHSTLAVFDLDSTLYDLTLRVTAIIDRFAQSRRLKDNDPAAAAALAQVEIRRTDWGLSEPLARAGLTRATHASLINEIQAAWVEGFFSNDFLDRDFPLPGAVRFVHDCLSSGAHVLYLTGRDTPRMGSGTELSLKACGFPLDGERSRLQLKPDKSLDDARFKADVISDLAKKYETVWLFENEPVNINAVLKQTPSVKIVFIETCHSGLEDVQTAVARVPHFDVSLEELE